LEKMAGRNHPSWFINQVVFFINVVNWCMVDCLRHECKLSEHYRGIKIGRIKAETDCGYFIAKELYSIVPLRGWKSSNIWEQR